MTEETWSRPSGRKADELRPIKITIRRRLRFN